MTSFYGFGKSFKDLEFSFNDSQLNSWSEVVLIIFFFLGIGSYSIFPSFLSLDINNFCKLCSLISLDSFFLSSSVINFGDFTSLHSLLQLHYLYPIWIVIFLTFMLLLSYESFLLSLWDAFIGLSEMLDY